MKKEISKKLEDLRNNFQVAVEKLNKVTCKEDRAKLFEDSESINLEISATLEEQAKRLAQRAKVQWIEKGERSNKYFLNLIKNNQQRQLFS